MPRRSASARTPNAANATPHQPLTQATAAYATALGGRAKATATAAVAIGKSAQATGIYSASLGAMANASGMYSIAMGVVSRAQGKFRRRRRPAQPKRPASSPRRWVTIPTPRRTPASRSVRTSGPTAGSFHRDRRRLVFHWRLHDRNRRRRVRRGPRSDWPSARIRPRSRRGEHRHRLILVRRDAAAPPRSARIRTRRSRPTPPPTARSPTPTASPAPHSARTPMRSASSATPLVRMPGRPATTPSHRALQLCARQDEQRQRRLLRSAQ